MRKRRPVIVTAAQAASLVRPGDTVLIGGSGGGVGTPEGLLAAVAARFQETGEPGGLTAVHPVGCGDWGELGMSRFALPGMLKRQITGSLGNSPATMALAAADAIEAYTLPQGVLSQLCRDIAAGRPGLVTHVGLGSFVDPRNGGGRQSARSTDDLVELIELNGREYLFYRSFPIDVTFIRATTADAAGNLTMEKEPFIGDPLAMAQAAHNCGGIVVAQVERLRTDASPSRVVAVPGILVDAIVVDPDQSQTYLMRYSPGYSGEFRIPFSIPAPTALDPRLLIARRASLELFPGAIANLGFGVATGIADLVAHEGVAGDLTLTVEQGVVGGTPVTGVDFGVAVNYDALIEQSAQFDFYDGGGLDIAFLSFAEVDPSGNVNVSRFAGQPNGSGGFIHIAQNAKSVCFLGTLTAGGLKVSIEDGGIRILREGAHRRFVPALEQKTYDRGGGRAAGQRALYITERAVFETDGDGLVVTEVAPGIDLARDVLPLFQTPPRLSPSLSLMPEHLFRPGSIGLRERFDTLPVRTRHPRITSLLGSDTLS